MNTLYRFYGICSLFFIIIFLASCNDDDYETPGGGKNLENKCIKRTIGPNLIGEKIEFVYAMALAPENGRLVSAKVEASIPGAAGTYFDNKSYYTNGSGQDVGVEVCSPSVTEGKITEISYVRDTCAATLRFYYVIPEEARGKEVSFIFSATDSNGKTVSMKMGSYTISEIDMKLDIILKNDNYFSIEDMAVYDADQIMANPEKADLVYLFRPRISFLHSLVSPAADPQYLPDITIPEGFNNSTRFFKVFASADQHLARNEFGVFVDDYDLRKMNFENTPDFGINMKVNSGAWVETADGRYRAYFYVNKVSNPLKQMTISIKRLKVK